MLHRILLAASIVVALGALAAGAQELEELREGAPARKNAVIIVNNVPVLRKYYLTKTGYDGAHALTACTGGYHMASLFEIVNPSQLSYNTSLGFTEADSGQGPPNAGGWVRTGEPANSENCKAWTTFSSSDNGPSLYVPVASSWRSPAIEATPWDTIFISCDSDSAVWCVQDVL